jgi:hypothetical protein
MGRTMIGSTTTELQSDSGSVLWSFVQGEQLEFPVTLSFIQNVSLGYAFEAVVIEGANEPDSTTPPEAIQPNGVQTKLTVRVPLYRDTWNAATTYHKDDMTLYSGKYYHLKYLLSYVSAVTPNLDPNWTEVVGNVIYVQFPKTLSLSPAWAVQPTAASKVYGFFELRVTENTGAIFAQTWKPMRGLVELQFSPTEVVPDI